MKAGWEEWERREPGAITRDRRDKGAEEVGLWPQLRMTGLEGTRRSALLSAEDGLESGERKAAQKSRDAIAKGRKANHAYGSRKKQATRFAWTVGWWE